jgi:hypothetical protein
LYFSSGVVKYRREAATLLAMFLVLLMTMMIFLKTEMMMLVITSTMTPTLMTLLMRYFHLFPFGPHFTMYLLCFINLTDHV